jgi:hypothetical protein
VRVQHLTSGPIPMPQLSSGFQFVRREVVADMRSGMNRFVLMLCFFIGETDRVQDGQLVVK